MAQRCWTSLLIQPDSQIRQAGSLTQKYRILRFSLRQGREKKGLRDPAGRSHKNSQFRRDMRTKAYVYEYIFACSLFLTGNRKTVYIQTLWEGQVCRRVWVLITAGELSCPGAKVYSGWQHRSIPAVLCCSWWSLSGLENARESSKSTGELRAAHPQPCSNRTSGDIVYLQLSPWLPTAKCCFAGYSH